MFGYWEDHGISPFFISFKFTNCCYWPCCVLASFGRQMCCWRLGGMFRFEFRSTGNKSCYNSEPEWPLTCGLTVSTPHSLQQHISSETSQLHTLPVARTLLKEFYSSPWVIKSLIQGADKTKRETHCHLVLHLSSLTITACINLHSTVCRHTDKVFLDFILT